ncbi:mannosyltransferase family protein [Carbonactinospora thermoautotrophica]|uniref:mannosyltransferase family protein n=1 Tax=Carbonactinospora thermoautotrophica TaxID=1469144 RepID=UPI00226E51D9|nr:mannosyltransferase family protein [Carbonactinospora thermoautotrophica]
MALLDQDPVVRADPKENRGCFRVLSGGDLAALRLWLLTRVSVFLLVGASAWIFSGDANAKRPVPYLQRWAQWDWEHYQHIAQYGYFNPDHPGRVPLEAFFPGFPLLVRAVHVVVPDWVLAGLLVSFVAGAVAMVALRRLADLEAPGTGERAVLLLLLAPTAVFLAAGYTEALFLAFAIPAWLAARRGRWWLAGLLAGCSAVVRVSGLFLGCALVVEFLLGASGLLGRVRAGERVGRVLLQAPALAFPFLSTFAYAAYLHAKTGDWLAWQHAQEKGWYRRFMSPVDTFLNTWHAAVDGLYPTQFAWMFRIEILTVAVGVALTGWLLARRRWGEATWVGLQVVALGTSFWYFSVPRAALLWWPLWIGLAAWSRRRPGALTAYLVTVAPFMVVFTLAFSTGRWAG